MSAHHVRYRYPGYEGGNAIAGALFGAFSPAGKLPVTLVQDLTQLPAYTDFFLETHPGRTHRHFVGTPLFPFGFGLSFANRSFAQVPSCPNHIVLFHTRIKPSGDLLDEGGPFTAFRGR